MSDSNIIETGFTLNIRDGSEPGTDLKVHENGKYLVLSNGDDESVVIPLEAVHEVFNRCLTLIGDDD